MKYAILSLTHVILIRFIGHIVVVIIVVIVIVSSFWVMLMYRCNILRKEVATIMTY